METNLYKKSKRLLMISTDRSIFEEGSSVRSRQIAYADEWEEVHIIVATSRKYQEISIGKNIWIYPSQSRFKLFYPLDIIRLGRFIIPRRNITNITCQDPFFTAVAGTSLQKLFNIPLEIQLHTDIGSPFFTYNFANKIRKILALSYIRKADHIRVVSSRIKNYLVEKIKISGSKIEVKPIVTNIAEVQDMQPIVNLHEKYPQFKKIVLMASRLEAEKNIPLALKAWKDFVQSNQNVGLIIVGKGSQESKLKKIVVQYQLSETVIFENWVNRNVLISYYKTADAFLNTSYYEGYGLTLVEAQAARCPIISTDVGVARELGAVIIKDKNELITVLKNVLSR